MFTSELRGFTPVALHSTPKCEMGGINKTLLITLLVVGTLALLPTVSAVCEVAPEAYKMCVEQCAALGADRVYDACVGRCAQQFLNPYC